MTKPNEPTTPPPTENKGVTVGTIRDLIREEIAQVADKLLPGKKSGAPSTGDDGEETGGRGDVKTQVSLALQQLKARESREQRDKEVDEMLAKYKEPPKEEAPVERRFIEKLMRWHNE